MDKIFIFGHRKPDTDSVCSAITLSYLYNNIGYDVEPRILSDINDETKFVLNKFNMEIPQKLNDVKLQISDINYHKDFSINNKESVYNAFYKMHKNSMSCIPVTDNFGNFLGVFAMKDIAKNEILGNIDNLQTKYEYILDVLEGKECLKFNDEIIGNITNINIRSTTFITNNTFDKNTILIIGDRHAIIEDAINKKVKLIILTNNAELKEEHLEIAKKNKVNIIYTEKNSYETLMKIGFANYIENYNYVKKIVCVNEIMEVNELNDIINKTKHSYYPVIDANNKCLGLLKLADLRDNKPKKVLLVDHNEASQSVEGIDEAEIVGIVDHHKLGTLLTTKPINFRNMTVGSTCTIIYYLYKENKVKMPKEMAGLLLSGIISDTLCLKSPTTTDKDEIALKDLAKKTEIDVEKYAMEMFKAGDNIKSKSINEIVYMDFKTFEIDKKIVGIGQINTLNAKAILKQKNSYIDFLDKESIKNNYDVFVFCITDIFKNGSYILFNNKAKDIVRSSFDDNLNQGDFLDGVISRKKQVLPAIMSYLN